MEKGVCRHFSLKQCLAILRTYSIPGSTQGTIWNWNGMEMELITGKGRLFVLVISSWSLGDCIFIFCKLMTLPHYWLSIRNIIDRNRGLQNFRTLSWVSWFQEINSKWSVNTQFVLFKRNGFSLLNKFIFLCNLTAKKAHIQIALFILFVFHETSVESFLMILFNCWIRTKFVLLSKSKM